MPKSGLKNLPLTPPRISELDNDQKRFLKELSSLFESTQFSSGNELQQAIYNLAKEKNIESKKAFQAIYIALINKDHGPKAGWLVLDALKVDKHFVIRRLEGEIELKKK